MNVGDRVRFLKNVTWEGTAIQRGTTGKVERVGTSGVFVRVNEAAEAVYAFRGEIEPIGLKVRAKGGKL